MKSVIFAEDWYIDPESMRMWKKVVGVAPVRHFEDYDTSVWKKQVPFFIYFNNAK